MPFSLAGVIIELSNGSSHASDHDIRRLHGRLLLVLPLDASEGRAVRFRFEVAIPGLQRSRRCGTGHLYARRTWQRNARSNVGWRVAQGIRSMAGTAPRPAKALMAGTLRQHAASALDGALCVRIYCATPLQPSRGAGAL